jgi:O-antigen/teichoic acid export membrane protein
MFDGKLYLRNILCNWIAFAVSVGVGFFLSPLIVKRLGDAGYGFWSLVIALTAYFSYMDLGIQSGVGHYVTRHLNDGNTDALNAKANSALTILSALGLLAFLAACAASLFFTRLFHVSGEAVPAVRGALLLMGGVMALKLPLAVFHSMLAGAQRFDILSGTAIGVKLFNAALVSAVLLSGGGFSGFALAVASTQFLEAALVAIFALRIVPQIRLRPFTFRRGAFRELMDYGIFNFLINLCGQFGAGFAAFLIGHRIAAQAVTYWSIGSEMLPYMAGLVSAVTVPLLQIVIPMDVRSDLAAMRELLLTGTRYLFALICLIGLNLLLVGPDFLARWMGDKYLDPLPYGSSGTVLILMTLANMAALSSSVAQQILFGRRRNRLFAAFTLAETAATLMLALVLIPRLGILGVAVAYLIPMAAVEGLLIPFSASRQVGSGALRYLGKGILPNLAVAALVFAAYQGLSPWLPGAGHPRSWGPIFLSFTAVSMMHIALAWFILVEKAHKARLLNGLSETPERIRAILAFRARDGRAAAAVSGIGKGGSIAGSTERDGYTDVATGTRMEKAALRKEHP